MDTSAILDETLELTEADHGTSEIVSFEGVQCPRAPLPLIIKIEVTEEAVQDAALRFRGRRVTMLNFASGVMPGGGVRYGSMAQEEALCLSTGLLHGLEGLPEFYERNRKEGAPPESYDSMIWSEGVPLVRDGSFELVEPMSVNVITYPAPNSTKRVYLGSGRFGDEDVSPDVRSAIFERRCRHVLAQAERTGTEVLVLGAWGCGVYGNDPSMVAGWFYKAILEGSGSISTVVFAIYGNIANQMAFETVFTVCNPKGLTRLEILR